MVKLSGFLPFFMCYMTPKGASACVRESRVLVTLDFKNEKNARPRELQTRQSHLYAWQDHGGDSPRNHANAYEKQGGWRQPAWLH